MPMRATTDTELLMVRIAELYYDEDKTQDEQSNEREAPFGAEHTDPPIAEQP